MEILNIITVDCYEVESMQNELLIYVADEKAEWCAASPEITKSL